MGRSAFRVSLTACVAVALSLATLLPSGATGASRAGATPVPQGFVGMVVDYPTWPNPYVDMSQQLDTMVASGVDSIRVVVDWSQAQPYSRFSAVPASARGQFASVGGRPTDFSSYDALVAAAARQRR